MARRRSTVDWVSTRLSINWSRIQPATRIRRLYGFAKSQVVVLRVGELWPLNPQVRGSSPWRRTRSRPLTCTHAIDKILCRSHVDVPVLERCSLADTGAAWSPLVTMITIRDHGNTPARCSVGAAAPGRGKLSAGPAMVRLPPKGDVAVPLVKTVTPQTMTGEAGIALIAKRALERVCCVRPRPGADGHA
jgi:hypothetical protein